MKINHWNQLEVTHEEYETLQKFLGECGVSLIWSSSSAEGKTCYVRNAYKEVIGLWGNDMEKKLAKEFEERYNR